ncbi:hypothetical protein JB92DRAFT_3007439 [Gautieria morchelliformis]|nr:hypothetical protein JB92DRAFT_3007439 [Gautieria morchelliformis]
MEQRHLTARHLSPTAALTALLSLFFSSFLRPPTSATMRASYLLFLACALAGQAYATVTVTLNPQTSVAVNFTASDLVNFGPNDAFVTMANCTAQCGAAAQQISGCAGNDQCVCTNTTGTALLHCEQCLFTYAVDKNVRPPTTNGTMLLGSQPALDGFVATCLAPPFNTTIQALKMVPPPSWDGPESNKLSLPATVVAVFAGAILGSGSLYILTHIE